MTQTIRIQVHDWSTFTYPKDLVTGKLPSAYTNKDLSIKVLLTTNTYNFNSVYQGVSLLAEDVSDIDSSILEIKPMATRAAPEQEVVATLSQTVTSFDETATLETWYNKTKHHMEFTFTDVEMDITPGKYWMSCYVTIGESKMIIFAGPITIKDPGT